MKLTSLKLETLEDLFRNQLRDLYDAEQRIANALPKMEEAAHDPELKSAFSHHLQETENHVKRLEQAFWYFGEDPETETCDAIKGLISEGEEIVKAKGSDEVRDAGLIAAAQRVEHYEMAGYGTLRTLAQRIWRNDIADLLQQTLDEEGAADKKLTSIAESGVNTEAATA